MNSVDSNHTDVAALNPVDVFMSTPLVQWIHFLLNREIELEDLVDGVALNEIMLQIDPRPTNMKANRGARSDVNLNIQNLTMLLKHIKSYYEEVQKQVIVMSLPKVLQLVHNVRTPEGLAEMQKLLLLVLGCAVQCDQRERFVEKMKQLTYEGMETMMNHIKDITENTDKVLNLQWEELVEIPPEDLEELTRKMSLHIRSLVSERDNQAMLITDVTQERDYFQSQAGGGNLIRRESLTSPATRQHLMVELNDLKAKFRKAKQELDEKIEQNIDLKAEIEELQTSIRDITQQKSILATDARATRALRDENDILKERATKASKLEFELDILKEKVKDVDFYKHRVDELRDDNKILHETKTLVEEQLEETRTRLDGLMESEKRIVELKRQLHEMTQERENDQCRIQSLTEIVSNLEFDKMQSMNESGNLAYQLEQARGNMDGGRMSILDESQESAHNRALRLEKENKRLQALISKHKDESKTSEITQASLLELEKENQRLSNRVQQLQEHINKEKQSVLDFEQLSTDLTADRQRLEGLLETSRASSDRRVQEMEQENNHLVKTIESLRERAKIGANEKVKAIEKEKQGKKRKQGEFSNANFSVLSELVQDITTKHHKLEYETKRLNEKIHDMEDTVQQAKEINKENMKLEKQNVDLEKTVKQLELTCSRMDTVEQLASDLEVENRQLKAQVQSLKQLTHQLQQLEDDKTSNEMEITRLKRQVESLKKTCQKMANLEQDKLEAEKNAMRFQQSLETMKAAMKNSEKMEVVQMELESELERVRSQLEVHKERLVIREKEINEIEVENEELHTKVNHLVVSNKRLESLESENNQLEAENTRLVSTNKRLTNEVQRVKNVVEIKTTEFEESLEKITNLTRHNKVLCAETEELRVTVTRLNNTEVELKKLQTQQAIEKRTLTQLREDLVSEKLTSQQRLTQLESLNTELQKIGISQDELQNLDTADNDKRFKALESKLDSTLKKSLQAKEEKIESLEARLKESVNLNNKLRSDIKGLKRDYESMSQRLQEEMVVVDGNQPKGGSRGSSGGEIFKIKDHLISVERKNATLLADNAAMKSSSQDLQSHVKSLQSQVSNLHKQQDRLQESNDSLQKQYAKLQVENSTLQSKCTSLIQQNAVASSAQNNVESTKAELNRKLMLITKEKQQLEKDNDDLTVLHERQTMELEGVMQDHQKLKQLCQQLRNDNKDLEAKYNESLMRSKQDLNLRKSETSLTSQDLEALKEAHDKLNKSYKNVYAEYEDLQSDHSTLKTAHNRMKIEYAKLEAETTDIKDHNQQLDIATAKLSNRCEVLMQLKGNLEDENRHLLEQISRLMSQNEELLSQALEGKDQIYSEQKQYNERMQEIRRQKEKLEEKIMDLYRAPGHSPAKRKGFGTTIKKKFQSLGKNNDARRRKDGLPPSTSATTLTHYDSAKLASDTTSETALSSSASAAQHDSASVGSNEWAEDTRRDSATSKTRQMKRNMSLFNHLRRIYPAQNKGSYSFDGKTSGESKETKRRSKLGQMAYSTNAINQLSVAPPTQTTDLRTSNSSIKIAQNRASSFSHQKPLTSSTGDLSLPAKPEKESPHAPRRVNLDLSHNGEKISLKQFLKEDSTKHQGKPVPYKRSPDKQRPIRAASWTTPRRNKSPSWFEDEHTPPAPNNKRPPSLDLTSLVETPEKSSLSVSLKKSPRTPNSPTKSPTSLAVIKVQEKEDMSENEKRNLKKETMVFVVRSHSDIGKAKTGDSSSVVLRSNVSPRQRPMSMNVKPESPSGSMSAVQRLDTLVGSPSSGPHAVPRPAPRSSPNDTTFRSFPGNVTLRSRASGTTTNQQRRPTSAYSPFSSNSRAIMSNEIFSRELTSTPISSKTVDGPSVSPIISENSQTPKRRDVPPPDTPSAPSPIRRDVPPDMPVQPRRPRSVVPPSPTDQVRSQPRPATPKRTTPEENEQSTLWYEYGCV
uniref:girdin n=1 Tax=Ciona intestinalis TaxID=7719 RepID=UPI00089DA96D|nr:girdin [Ciona intestinalis]|eukprot:XP_026692572.1 girdin [Ciona intestinalis]